MQVKLMTKSKVIQTKTTKSHVFRRKIKPKRSNTSQRWSRRIRSLPPIPINVLRPGRKMRKNRAVSRREMSTSTTYLNEIRKKNFQNKMNRERRKSEFVSKSPPVHDSDSVEVVRIVPVVVYVKKSTQPKKGVPEEVRVHINDNPTCEMVSQVIDSHIRKKIKQERSSLGRGYSKRNNLMSRYAREGDIVQEANRKYLYRRKLLHH